MSWRSAFIAQARSDNEVRKLLNRSKVAYAHQLHYLQMVTEKLAKGFMKSPSTEDAPAFSHAAFVSFLRTAKESRELRKKLGYQNRRIFSAFIDSLLPFADKIERLSPTFAGETKPNPEYPWRPTPDDEVLVPAEFDFPELKPDSIKIIQLVDLVEKLLNMSI